MNFHVGSVLGAEGDGSVEHELHVARSRGFGSGKGDLLADVGGGHKQLGQRHAVVLNINHLQLALHVRVAVHKLCNGADKLNNLFGKIISGSRLCTENIGLGHKGGGGIFLYIKIFRQNVQSVHVLTLIFVHTLYLNVENRVGVALPAPGFFNIFGKADFIVSLDFHKVGFDGRVVLILKQLFQL